MWIRASIASVVVVLGLAAPAKAQRSQPVSLPDGDAKSLVESACTACHGLNLITNGAGLNTAEEWRNLIRTMVDLADAQEKTIAGYLATHFPEKPGRRPTLVPGDTRIEIAEWVMPTLGQRSRDPIEAPDGSIWWTGMWSSVAGRIDLKTMEMEEYHLPRAAKPHSIIAHQDGSIWYTGNSNATLGRLDPKTGLITEYPTKASDPHTGLFHPNGKLYFTAQQAAMLGRLDPATGELTEVETEPRPYGIQVDREGTLWIAYNGTNKIGAMDPDTMEVRYYPIAEPESRIRRLALTSDGMVWYGNSTMGRIGRLDPKTGAIKEWPSPSGPTSHPYALAVIDDVIWYNESGMRPDALVRFDPATEKFQSWAIPSGVGIVRRMWVTRGGDLLIHQTSSNRVGLVKIQKPAGPSRP
jgi:virginiamycin B lyase